MKVYVVIRETHRTDEHLETSIWHVVKKRSEAERLANFWNEHAEYSTFYIEEWEVE